MAVAVEQEPVEGNDAAYDNRYGLGGENRHPGSLGSCTSSASRRLSAKMAAGTFELHETELAGQ